MATEQKTGENTIQLLGGQSVHFKVNNSKRIKLFTNCSTTEIKQDNNITELTIGNYTLKVGEPFEHGLESIPAPYQVNYITTESVKGYHYGYLLHSHLGNRTTQYILPCLGLSGVELGYASARYPYEDSGYLINAYLTKEPNKIALMYRFSTHESYGKLETSLSRQKGFVTIDSSIPNFDLVIMEISKEFVKDVSLFQQGSYSKLSPLLKEKIVSFHGLKEKDKLWQIIHKGKDLMGKMEKEWNCNFTFLELENKPNLDEEFLKV